MLSVLFSIVLGAAVAAEGEDPLDLVGLLVRDAAWDRARAAIDEVTPDRGVDPVRYHALRGTILAAQELWDEAAGAFSAAIEASDPEAVDPVLYLQLAQAQVRAARPEEALRTLEAAPEAARGIAGYWLVTARAARDAGDTEASFAALEEGAARFPASLDFPRQQVLLLVELGLYREAGERGAALLARDDARADDVLTIAEALRRGGAPAEANLALTQGMLRFPAEIELRVLSAAVALGMGRTREGANQLALAAAADPEYADEAAELYRKAGDLQAALRWNGAVVDAAAKARQRLGLLLEAERWDQVLALEERLGRLDLLSDSAVAYGLAYARFRVHDLEPAEAHLRRVTDPQVFALANELRAAITACREDPWSCP